MEAALMDTLPPTAGPEAPVQLEAQPLLAPPGVGAQPPSPTTAGRGNEEATTGGSGDRQSGCPARETVLLQAGA